MKSTNSNFKLGQSNEDDLKYLHQNILIMKMQALFNLIGQFLQYVLVAQIIRNQLMNASRLRQRQKLTLTELQRYLPLLPPPGSWDLPESIRKYLLSSSFNNFSLKEQALIKQNYDIAYRSYYSVERIVDHLNTLTDNKFTLESIEQTICNCAQKYQLIDWFLFTRIVSNKRKNFGEKSQLQAISFIIQNYKRFLEKKRVLNGIKDVEALKKSLEERLVREFGKEALNQVKEFVDRNRIEMQKKLKQHTMSKKIPYIQFEHLINGVLQCALESKKVKYLYLRYDYRNFGAVLIEQFLSEVFTERKPVVVPQPNKYLIEIGQIMDFVRSYMTQLYYSQHEMAKDYLDKYHQKYAEYYLQSNEDSNEINQYQLYHFIKDKCVNKLSFLQTNLIHKQIQFAHNLQFLFVKPNFRDLTAQVLKFTLKKERKKLLKKQHENFYSFKRILMYIVSKSKSKKMTREQFTQFVVGNEPSLKYDAFYCVWRVYGNLINVQRMKNECKLNPLACYFKLFKSDDDYEKIIQNLLDAFPEGVEVPYNKVEQKINLYCEFVLDNQQIKPLTYGDYDLVDYRKCINQILPLDFDIKARTYLFRKIAEKFIGIWKGIKIKKEYEKKKKQMMQAFLNKLVMPLKGKIQAEEVAAKKGSPQRRLIGNKSSASLQSKFSGKSKKEVNPQTLQIARGILTDIFNEMTVLDFALKDRLQNEFHYKRQLILTSGQRYTYRSFITRGYFHHLFGILGMSKDFLKLMDNHQEKIDIKIPYKPNIEIVDFVVWNNDIVVLTSYNTIEIYTLGQGNNYPIRTIEFNKGLSFQNISVKMYDQIVSERFFGRYPILLKSHKELLLVNLLHNGEICLVNQDTTRQNKSIFFNYKEHFYPKVMIRIFDLLKKQSNQRNIKFMEDFMKTVKVLKDQDYNHNHGERIRQCFTGQLQSLRDQLNNFDIRQIAEFMTTYNSSILKCVFKTELNLKQKYHLPAQLMEILKLLIDYMKDNNFSLHQILLEITKHEEQIILLKEFKNYLLKITYELFVMYEKEIDKFLKNVSTSKYIEYSYLADIIGYNWNYQILEKPFFVIHNFILVPEYSIIIYTLQGFNTIFIKNSHSHEIIAKLNHHQCTPIIHYIPQSMVLISADSKRIAKDRKIGLCIWRIYEDLIAVFTENPPWKISPYYSLPYCHEQAVTSISYLPRCHTLITTSLDSTIKFWSINDKPFGLSELKRVYSNDFYYLSADVYEIFMHDNEIKLEFLLANKISKQVSNSNIYRYEMTVEIHLVELVKIKVPENSKYFEIPVRMRDYMIDYGEKLSKKKKALLAKKGYQEIKSLNKARLMLESLDKNIYNSLKNAYIFQNYRQIRLITDFLSKNEHSEMIVRNVCEQYGLDLINSLQQNEMTLNSLTLPPQLPGYQTFMKSNINEIHFPHEVVEQIFDKIVKNSSSNSTLVDIESLYKIVSPYLFGDNEAKFDELLGNYIEQTGKGNASMLMVSKTSTFFGKQGNNKLIEIAELRKMLKGYEIKGQLDKFYVSMRSLLIFLKEKHINIWEIFSVNRKELEKFKKIRVNELTETLLSMGFNRTKLLHITNYLSKNGNISLYEFIHYAKVAKEQAKPSELVPNYSSLLLTKSKIFEQQHSVMQRRMEASERGESPMMKSDLQSQLEDMLKRRSSKLSEIQSQQDQKSRHGSIQKIGKKENIDLGDNGGSKILANSNSKGSLSKDITYTKDTQKRQALEIMRKLKQLLKNQGKSLWQILALSIPEFLWQPIITETEYFLFFDYIKTPFRLQEKLKLLVYLKREAANQIDINTLFELTENAQKQKPHGEKYIISYLVEKFENFSNIIDQALQMCFFSEREESSVDDLMFILSKDPFNCCNFVLKQFELILLEEKRLVFTASDIKNLIVGVIEKHKLKIELNKVNFINDLIYKIENKGLILHEAFPKYDKVNLAYFTEHAKKVYNDPTFNCLDDFKSIVYSVLTEVKKDIHQVSIKYNDFIKELEKRIGTASQNENKELQICKKLVKHLQTLKITLFQFFVMIDRNKKYYITQEQLEIGLVEVNLNYDLWSNIPKKYSKRLYYYEFINYLLKKNILTYKSIDSQLEIAMEKFIKRFMRNDDIERVFTRLRGENAKNQVNFQQFKRTLKMVNYFKEEEIIYLFSLFANDNIVKDNKLGNDDLIKDVTNLSKAFNFKKFVDIVSIYRSQNITKTAQFRFYDYIKKRNVSLIFEFKKWLQKNKKLKEITEAMKKQTLALSKDTFLLFLNEIKGGLNEKELKELVARYKEDIEFNTFYGQLEDIYKKGNSNIEKEEVEYYLQEMIKRIVKQNVTLERLFSDFAKEKVNRMSLHQFGELCSFLSIGFNKIQIKKIYNYLDKEKKSYIAYSDLMDAVEDAQRIMQKDEQDYKFDYIVEKIMNNPSKYVLKSSKLSFNLDRACIIFENVLSRQESELLYTQALKELKKELITQKELEQYLNRKIFEFKLRCDKKDKEMIIKLLNYLKRINLEIDEIFNYLSKHSSRQEIKKIQFNLLYQTLELKSNLVQINSLFNFLDENKKGSIAKSKWEDKLNMIYLEQEIQLNIQNEDLKLFYKVKLFLSEVYLIFIRKSYKNHQIYHFFDRHSNGVIAYDEMMQSLNELGIVVEEDMSKKVINYLDKNRERHIRVGNLLVELENCLGSKMRLILQTKTSHLFKEKSLVFQEKSTYFISELARRQELVEISGVYKSCIPEYSIISLLKQFGCALTEDEIQDIHKNFMASEGYLYLYPIYTTFINLFKDSAAVNMQAVDAQRYKKLLMGMIKNNYTIENLSKLNSYKQLYNFIEQLGVFTPIDIKLIIDSNLYESSFTVDIDSLKQKIKNAYLTKENEQINQSFIAFANNTHDELKKQLKEKVDIAKFVKQLGATQGKINLETFQNTLIQMNVVVTKGVAKKYFDFFSEGHEYLELGHFVKEFKDAQILSNSLNLFGKTAMSLMSNNSQMKDSLKLQQIQMGVIEQAVGAMSGSVMIAEHVVKCLNFRGVSLDSELNKYYESNYGYVRFDNLLGFYGEIGLDKTIYAKQIASFLEDFSQQINKKPFDKQILLKVQKLQAYLSEICNKYVQLQLVHHVKEYTIGSEQMRMWIAEMSRFQADLDGWLNENSIYEFSLPHLFQFLSTKYPQHRHIVELFVKQIPNHIASYDAFYKWLDQLQKKITLILQNQKEQQIINDQLEKGKAESIKPSHHSKKAYMLMFLNKNPIKTYQNSIGSFTAFDLTPEINNTNIQRLSINIFYEYILNNKFLLEITPNLIQPQSYISEKIEVKINPPEQIYNIKTLNSITIDEEDLLDRSGLVLINKRYYGLPISMKFEFENMAILSNILDPSAAFLKTRNFYLWEPNPQLLPKAALNYRWRYIPIFAKQLLQQLSKIHSLGFCLPHLRWQHLNKSRFIDKVVYPCPIDKFGRIKTQIGFASLQYEDPYCCPEFFRFAQNQKFSFKCDSWIFGCLLYEFIYGHPPKSFLEQLKQYLKNRHIKSSIGQVLQMQQLPYEFNYIFYDNDRLNSLLNFQHELKLKDSESAINFGEVIKREQSFRGLTFSLQLLYGEEYKFYKQEFKIIEELNDIIYECLQINYENRPSIQGILSRKIFQQNYSIQQFKDALKNHISSEQFYTQMIQPIHHAFTVKKQKRKYGQVIECLQLLNKNIHLLTFFTFLPDQLVIPKYYPWPIANGIYSSKIIENKERIRQTSNFNILSLFFNSAYLEMITFLAVESEGTERELLFDEILNLISRLLLIFKEYSNASCGFVVNILDILLKLIYEEPRGILNEGWIDQIDIKDELKKRLDKQFSYDRKHRYLTVHNFEARSQKRCLSILSTIVYLNGEGNIEYLPISHYLQEHQQVRQLMENIFCHIKLMSGVNEEQMMLNYFRDRIAQQQKFKLQLKIKIEVDLVKFLTSRSEIKTNILHYFKDMLTYHDPNSLTLFKHTLIYIYFVLILRDPNQSIINKQIVLEIIMILLSFEFCRKIIHAPSSNIVREIMRLMIQPAKNHPVHKEYEDLKSFLEPIAIYLNQNTDLLEELTSEVEGADFIIDNFLKKIEEGLTLSQISNMKS